MATPSFPVFAAGTLLQGRYRLDAPIATGGMAEVWRGHDEVLQRAVAVKLLHPHLAADPLVVERFRREAVSAARLSHPHIVPTYDAGADGGAAYIVLGLVDGPTLAERLRNGPLPLAEALAIASQVADALAHAHDNGFLHRDVKPSNVLVLEDGRALMGDFGIAKAVAEATDSSLTLPGLIVGSPAYAAPEQLRGDETDARTDVYGVGLLLHEMICGHPMEDRESAKDDEVRDATQLSRPASTSARSTSTAGCSALPDDVEQIVQRATAPRPQDRFTTADHLRDAIDSLARRRRHSPIAVTSRPPDPKGPVFRPATGVPTADGRTTASTSPTTDPHPVVRIKKPQMDTPRRSARRRRVTTAVVALLLVTGAVGLGRLLGSFGGDPEASAPTTAAPTTTAVSGARTFDPEGDEEENDQQTSAVLDGQASSGWSTDTYANRRFGNLKAGVGLVIDLSTSQRLGRLVVESGSTEWAARVYVGDGRVTDLAGWGTPVDTQSGLGPSATFDLHQAEGRSVLLWITDLGVSNRLTVNDIRFTR